MKLAKNLANCVMVICSIFIRTVQFIRWGFKKLNLRNNYTTFPIAPDFIRSEKGKHCRNNSVNVLKEFVPPSGDVADAVTARNECEEYCWTQDDCWGCSVYCGPPCQWNAIPNCGVYDNWTGLIDGDITQKSGGNRIHMVLS